MDLIPVAPEGVYLHNLGVSPRPRRSRLDLPIVSVFSGPGGLDLGFHAAGFRTILAADFSERAVETYNRNLPAVAKQLDLATTPVESLVELVRATGTSPRGVVGGPPCQSFSQANVNKRKNDPRAKLIFRFAEIVAALNEAFALDFFVMENVAALAKPKYRALLDDLKAEFENVGFVVSEHVLNARDFDVPQHRPRLFLVGIRSELAAFARYEFPVGQPTDKTLRSTIDGLPGPKFFERSEHRRRVPFHPNHWTMMPKSKKFAGGSTETGRSFKKLMWDDVSPAVAYGHREIHVHPTGKRRLSLFEALLLQGFPRKFVLRGNLSEQVTQVSNAVPPPLAKAVALSVRNALYDRRDAVQTLLLTYGAREGREFPWRKTSNTFHLLVAEKLLQQTAARPVVVKAYKEIIRRWPSPGDLARAPVSGVRRVVQPLGLTYRADELIALAKAIVSRCDGKVPLDRAALMRLPGVGEYAADAVLSFSKTTSAAVVDTNVSRLLHRLLGLQGDLPSNPARSSKLKRLATWFSACQDSQRMNYAILDFTAAVCIARSPECSACPINQYCVLRTRRGAEMRSEPKAMPAGDKLVGSRSGSPPRKPAR